MRLGASGGPGPQIPCIRSHPLDTVSHGNFDAMAGEPGSGNRSDLAILDCFDRPIAFHRCFVTLTGSVTAALMLSQAVYWQKRSKHEDGWWFKTRDDWNKETGMGRYEQESARKRLRQLGLLREDLRGWPAGKPGRNSAGTRSPDRQSTRSRHRPAGAGRLGTGHQDEQHQEIQMGLAGKRHPTRASGSVHAHHRCRRPTPGRKAPENGLTGDATAALVVKPLPPPENRPKSRPAGLQALLQAVSPLLARAAE